MQSKRATDGDAGESQINAFGDILQVWSYASQVGSLLPQTLVFALSLESEKHSFSTIVGCIIVGLGSANMLTE